MANFNKGFRRTFGPSFTQSQRAALEYVMNQPTPEQREMARMQLEQAAAAARRGEAQEARAVELQPLEKQKLEAEIDATKALAQERRQPKAVAGTGLKLTPGETAVDKRFANEVTRYDSSGGYATAMGQIDRLEGALGILEGGRDDISGPLIESQPELMRKVTSPKSVTVQQDIESTVQSTLKQTLGGQFAQKEGEMFLKRGYDPGLQEKDNAPRVRRMINELKIMVLSKQAAIDYFQENGTLKGYKGVLYTIKNGEMVQTSKDDFYKMMGGAQPKGNAPAAKGGGPRQGVQSVDSVAKGFGF